MTDAAISGILSDKSQGLWSVGTEATVFEAIQLMSDQNIGAVLVMSGKRLVGVLSERDYTRKVAVKGRSSRETKVSEIVSDSVLAVTPNHTVEACLRLMTTYRVRHLPVLEDDRVVGIISIGDLVNWIISSQSETIQQLENYIAGNYYA